MDVKENSLLLSPELFFHWKDARTIVDIRPAGAFNKGSFPRAISLPLDQFPSYDEFIAALKHIHATKPVHIIDVNGSTASHILNDVNLYFLKGGYKAFKAWREVVFLSGPPVIMIGGKTGSGKTECLHSLIEIGRQVIDLEELALHKGSVFGSIGNKQPTYENFQNNLLQHWLSLDISMPVWLEEKGHILGTVGLPVTLYKKMLGSIMVELEVSFETRLLHIQREYASMDKKIFAECIHKLEKRMGFSANHKVLHYYNSGQTEKCFSLLLAYYDRAYEKKREMNSPGNVIKADPTIFEKKDAVESLEKNVLSFYKKETPQISTGDSYKMQTNTHFRNKLRLKV